MSNLICQCKICVYNSENEEGFSDPEEGSLESLNVFYKNKVILDAILKEKISEKKIITENARILFNFFDEAVEKKDENSRINIICYILKFFCKKEVRNFFIKSEGFKKTLKQQITDFRGCKISKLDPFYEKIGKLYDLN